MEYKNGLKKDAIRSFIISCEIIENFRILMMFHSTVLDDGWFLKESTLVGFKTSQLNKKLIHLCNFHQLKSEKKNYV